MLIAIKSKELKKKKLFVCTNLLSRLKKRLTKWVSESKLATLIVTAD